MYVDKNVSQAVDRSEEFYRHGINNRDGAWCYVRKVMKEMMQVINHEEEEIRGWWFLEFCACLGGGDK